MTGLSTCLRCLTRLPDEWPSPCPICAAANLRCALDTAWRLNTAQSHEIRRLRAQISALAAGSRRAKTAKPVECEASQSGGSDSERNAQKDAT